MTNRPNIAASAAAVADAASLSPIEPAWQHRIREAETARKDATRATERRTRMRLALDRRTAAACAQRLADSLAWGCS
ncbi:hypothetical protein [Streptomyces hydrogenans]|uniref:hypothetical protein n=1 Tax=Streptomyces hydrogenans TaxID=1873719 RepID=UPI00380E429A